MDSKHIFIEIVLQVIIDNNNNCMLVEYIFPHITMLPFSNLLSYIYIYNKMNHIMDHLPASRASGGGLSPTHHR